MLGCAVAVGLTHQGWLDRTSSLYVAATTLRVLQGTLTFPIIVGAGALALALVWTATLRMQAQRWTSEETGSAAAPAASRVGALVLITAAVSAVMLGLYQAGLIRNHDFEEPLGTPLFAALMGAFVVAAVGGGAATWRTARAGGRHGLAATLGLLGFEAPLMTALIFGGVAWFSMRESVVAVTNDVDTPGDVRPMNRAVSLYPDLGFVYYLRGERHFANRDFPPALNDLNRSIDLDPRFAAAYLQATAAMESILGR